MNIFNSYNLSYEYTCHNERSIIHLKRVDSLGNQEGIRAVHEKSLDLCTDFFLNYYVNENEENYPFLNDEKVDVTDEIYLKSKKIFKQKSHVKVNLGTPEEFALNKKVWQLYILPSGISQFIDINMNRKHFDVKRSCRITAPNEEQKARVDALFAEAQVLNPTYTIAQKHPVALLLLQVRNQLIIQ